MLTLKTSCSQGKRCGKDTGYIHTRYFCSGVLGPAPPAVYAMWESQTPGGGSRGSADQWSFVLSPAAWAYCPGAHHPTVILVQSADVESQAQQLIRADARSEPTKFYHPLYTFQVGTYKFFWLMGNKSYLLEVWGSTPDWVH